MKIDKYSAHVTLASNRFDREKNYWLEKLQGNPVMSTFPADYSRPKLAGYRKAVQSGRLTGPAFTKLVSLSKGSEYGLYMMLLSGVKFLLHKYTSGNDIITGMPGFKRDSGDGPDDTMIILRDRIENHQTYKEFLMSIRQTVTEADEQGFPFEALVYLINLNPEDESLPLINTIVMLDNIHGREMASEIKADTVFNFTYNPGEILLNLEYNAGLYREETVNLLVKSLMNFYETVMADPGIKISDIGLLTDSDKKRLLIDFNNSAAVYPGDKTVQELFEEQAAETPDRVSVFEGEKRLTYRELNERANQLATLLRKRGIGNDSIVGILLERSPEMMVAILGILKAGGTYLPVDPEYPRERIQFILSDSNPALVIVQPGFQDKIGSGKDTLDFERIVGGLDPAETANPPKVNSSRDLAYVIYTSGSTGNPKGVKITHQGLTNYLWWAKKHYLTEGKADCPLFTSISFDLTVTSMYLPLITGGKIGIYRDDEKSFTIKRIIDDGETSLMKLTPTHLMLLDGLHFQKSSLRKLIVGGEELKTDLARRIYRKFNGAIEIFNEYGPTETVVGCMIHKFDPEKDVQSSVPIGVPADNVKIYVLSHDLQLMPIGAPGEIYISGDGVMQGYLNRPELTAERLLPDPYDPGRKMYKTGDLARWSPDGKLDFLGRVDFQVKIRGFRIELGEVESRLLDHKNIKEAVVIARDDETGGKYLCAYMVTEGEVTVTELRRHLAQSLPEYMIPSYFLPVEKFQFTVNGKIDRNHLPQPNLQRMKLETDYIAPRTGLEKAIADIWKEILKIDKVGLQDNFFDLGGHSLHMIQVNNLVNERLKEELAAEISVATMFQYPTIGSLLQNLSPDRDGNFIEEFETEQETRNQRSNQLLRQMKQLREYESE